MSILKKRMYLHIDKNCELFYVHGSKRQKLSGGELSWLEYCVLKYLSIEANNSIQEAMNKNELDTTQNATCEFGRARLYSKVPGYRWMTLSVSFCKAEETE